MKQEHEQSHASSQTAATTRSNATEPGQSSRSAFLRKSDNAVASGLVQRKASDANGVAGGAAHAVAAASSTSSSPLPDTLMRKFESSLGADLSGVRVHTGDVSAHAADAVGIKAYTMGNDIHFGAGHYDPSSSGGQHLLAHEVAHTVQQSGGAQRMQRKPEVSSPGDSLEHEADHAADAMVSGRAATVSRASGLSRHAKTLYRYKSGEHIQLGDTTGLIDYAESTYTVKKDETPEKIAKKTGVSVKEIKERNKDKLRSFQGRGKDKGKKFEGFRVGAKIRIREESTYTLKADETPEQVAQKTGGEAQVIKERNQAMLRSRVVNYEKKVVFPAKAKIQIPTGRKKVVDHASTSAIDQPTVTIQEMPFTYGEVIAMGDLYKSPEAVLNAPKVELEDFQKLFKEDAKNRVRSVTSSGRRSPVSGPPKSNTSSWRSTTPTTTRPLMRHWPRWHQQRTARRITRPRGRTTTTMRSSWPGKAG